MRATAIKTITKVRRTWRRDGSTNLMSFNAGLQNLVQRFPDTTEDVLEHLLLKGREFEAALAVYTPVQVSA